MDENNINQAQQQPPPQQEQKKEKKHKEQFALKPQHFQKQNGIKQLYRMTNELDLKNSELKTSLTMKKIVCTMKTWQFNLAPKYSYSYFLQRCQALSNHKLTQAYMQKVRRIHKNLDTWDEKGQLVNNPQANTFVQAMQELQQMQQRQPNQQIKQPALNQDKLQQQQDYQQLMQMLDRKNKKPTQSQDSGVEIGQNMYGVQIDDDYD